MGHYRVRNKPFLQSHRTLISTAQRVLDFVVFWFSLFAVSVYLESNEKINVAIWYSSIVVSLLYIGLAEYKHLYHSWRGQRIRRELGIATIILILSFGCLFLAKSFFPKFIIVKDEVVISWLILSWILIISSRLVFRLMLRYLRKVGYNHKTVMVIGAGDLGQKVATNITQNPWLGLDFVGFLDDYVEDEVYINDIAYSIKGKTTDAKNALSNVDRVYIALPMRAEERIRDIVTQLADSTVSVYFVPDIFMFELLNSRNEVVNGVMSISIHESPFSGINAILKRIEDIIVATMILLVIAIPIALIALAVKFTSKGPILFKQKRYGLDGKSILVWKFRSMTVMEDGEKVTQASKNDSRLTPIGGFIRRTSLDELPQFINVLTGQMSIVGPRPHAIAHNEEYRKLVKGYMLRHKVKPGITGWAQVNGWRGETDTLDKMEKRVEFDLDYIRDWSLMFDLKIIFMTIFKGFVGKNVY